MSSLRSFEMTIGLGDFRRLLPEALGGSVFTESGGSFLHAEEHRTWRIELEPMPALALGAIKLERHLVRWTFSGFEEAEIQVLLDRFERGFQRGGG